jgi:hypothetical protein
MASLPDSDMPELIEQAAWRQMSAANAELEAYEFAVAQVRRRCRSLLSPESPKMLATDVLDMLGDLP